MKNRFLLLSCLLLFVITNRSFSDPLIPEESFQQNKPFAIFLSVVSPGMGQIYSGQPEKGLTIWTSSSILMMGFLLNIADLDFQSVGGSFPVYFGMQFKSFDKITTDQWFWAAGFLASYAIIYVYNILDISFYQETDFSIDMGMDRINANFSIRF